MDSLFFTINREINGLSISSEIKKTIQYIRQLISNKENINKSTQDLFNLYFNNVRKNKKFFIKKIKKFL
jgi:hypothetical protein